MTPLAPLTHLVRQFAPGSRLERAWPLAGGVSAQVTALAIVGADGARRTVVLRRHGARDLAANPRIAATEFRLLQLLAPTDVLAPAPIFLDETEAADAPPGLVVTFIEGETVFSPADPAGAARTLADQLARIHAVTTGRYDLRFLPHDRRGFGPAPAERAETFDEGRIRTILEARPPPASRDRPALLHGDYWPSNVLWRDGRLVGVVDWEDACVGDPLLDMGRARLELLWAYGREAMEAFTRHYRSQTTIDWTDLPYWDLAAALRSGGQIDAWAGNAAQAQRMRDQLHWFVAQAADPSSLGGT